MKEYLKRFTNTGTILAIVGLAGNLLLQFGVAVDIVWLDNTAKLVCSLLIVLGAANNPTTKGVDLPTGTSNTEI